MPASPTSQRKLIAGVLIASLLLFGLVVADLARGGRPDPPALRAAAELLDGAWRFHTGDDPQWANPLADDFDWETLDLTAAPGSHDGDVGLPDYVGGWMAHGHAGYHGYAWYRREVTVPEGARTWDILGPTLVENGYELYWNGKLLGGSGRIGADPHVVGTRPMRFALPDDAAGTRGLLAIRVYMLPGDWGSADSGGIHSPPILAPRAVGEQLHHVQWERTIAGYIVEVVEPLAMFAAIGLALWCWSRSTQRGFLLFACIALALMAARRLNNAIVAWTDMMDLRTYSWLASVMWIPAVAAWTLAWNRWVLPAWRSIDVLALALAVAAFLGAQMDWDRVTSVSRYASIALFVLIGVRILRHGAPRWLAVATLISIMASLFGGELLDPLGVPGIWFPLDIGVSRTQYLYAIAVPLVALLFVRASMLRAQRDAAA
ncbi:MAG TPA: hypothetical protein VFP37_10635 [Steroidobacteraceae bacterium]|nr:hypothetical protein [Steroidobacteraceae bacterium]